MRSTGPLSNTQVGSHVQRMVQVSDQHSNHRASVETLVELLLKPADREARRKLALVLGSRH